MINGEKFHVKKMKMKNLDKELQMMIDMYYIVMPDQKRLILFSEMIKHRKIQQSVIIRVWISREAKKIL